MARYRMLIAYDGTNYGGWQVQPNATTIQETIQAVMKQILQEDCWITGSGRTDAGVHALGQVAHFDLSKAIDSKKLQISMNSLLPEDIRILSLEETEPDFHARYSAKKKIYHYHITIGVRHPFKRHYSTHFPYSLDIDLMKEASKHFIGTHDFTSFANEASAGSAAKNAVRTIDRIDIVPEEQGIRLEFEGNGFLYKMVRNIVGTLIEVAAARRSIEEIPLILKAKDRRKAGKAAPGHGLFLVKVDY